MMSLASESLMIHTHTRTSSPTPMVMAKLASTSAAQISLSFLVMNLELSQDRKLAYEDVNQEKKRKKEGGESSDEGTYYDTVSSTCSTATLLRRGILDEHERDDASDKLDSLNKPEYTD